MEGGVRSSDALSFGRPSRGGLRSQGCRTETETREKKGDVEWTLEESARMRGRKERRSRRRKREGMSFLLKKSCPNKGALFHAQCTPPQTRSLRYLSLWGVPPRSPFHTPRIPFPSFLSLWDPRERSFLIGLGLPTCETSARRYRGEIVGTATIL